MSSVKIGLIQMSCGTDRQANLAKALAMSSEAVKKGSQIVCLQELFTSRYFPQTVDVRNYSLAEPVPGPTLAACSKFARQHGICMIVPVYEEAMPGVYFNTAVLLGTDGEFAGKMRKIHIPEGPQYLEKYYFTPGDLGFPVFDTPHCCVGIGICWDEWFPETARILGLKGAAIVFFPSAIGSEPDRPGYSSQEAWETAIRAQGIMNGLFVATVNRVGVEDEMSFYGGSFIADPLGMVIAKGGSGDEIVTGDIDLERITEARNLLQFHRDRRPEVYQEILRIVKSGQ
ncbi:MAG: carbon-nitrogen hydrolase [Bacillota bacterium]